MAGAFCAVRGEIDMTEYTRTRMIVAACCAFALAAPAKSQQPSPSRDPGGLEEIVVTAQRKSERLQDVPIAITAVSASELAARGVRQAGDIAASVPNMLLNSPYGPEAQPTFTLRGVTTQDFSENQSSPIAMYVDEVYKPVGAVTLTALKSSVVRKEPYMARMQPAAPSVSIPRIPASRLPKAISPPAMATTMTV
jgi:hypothetical protein